MREIVTITVEVNGQSVTRRFVTGEPTDYEEVILDMIKVAEEKNPF